MTEIETLEAFERHLSSGSPFRNVVIQGLDLRGFTRELSAAPLEGSAFLGCQLEQQALQAALSHGAMVFPPFLGLPYQPYRGHLYTVEELYAGFEPSRPGTYADTLDARIYSHWVSQGSASAASILEMLAQRLHDHSVTDAVEELLAVASDGQPRKVVAIMGGHSMLRGQPDYRSVAVLARELTRRGFFMVSGGGPGAMEATHLGAWFARRTEAELDAAFAILSKAPSYKDPEWLSRAFEVRAAFPLRPEDRSACASLGIPTWHYGHEPPNAFATIIAKYFANSVREEGLITIARGGIIYSPGQRRHHPGDLPGRLPEPLQHRGRRQPDDLPRPRVLDAHPAHLSARGAAGPGPRVRALPPAHGLGGGSHPGAGGVRPRPGPVSPSRLSAVRPGAGLGPHWECAGWPEKCRTGGGGLSSPAMPTPHISAAPRGLRRGGADAR